MVGLENLSRTTRLALRVIAAKADIVNLGFPEIISKLFYEKYGNLAPLIARWFKQSKSSGDEDDPRWWQRSMYSLSGKRDLRDWTDLYAAATDPKLFLEVARNLGIRVEAPSEFDQEMLDRSRMNLEEIIRTEFFDEMFFRSYSLITDITNGQLKDIAPYKKLKFFDAQQKYEKRRYFKESEPLRVYDNGFRWIDVGRKSTLLSEKMKNCGSAGLMSMDKDATIVALFGPNGKPHVMVTYSPNEKKVSGDECAGSTAVKSEYHQYVIDLADHLGATFSAMKSKSPELGLKYRLRNKAQSLEKLKTAGYSFDSYFKFVVDGKTHYTDGSRVVSEDEVRRAQQMIKSGELEVRYPQKEVFKTVLLSNNQYLMQDAGIHVESLYHFLDEGA